VGIEYLLFVIVEFAVCNLSSSSDTSASASEARNLEARNAIASIPAVVLSFKNATQGWLLSSQERRLDALVEVIHAAYESDVLSLLGALWNGRQEISEVPHIHQITIASIAAHALTSHSLQIQARQAGIEALHAVLRSPSSATRASVWLWDRLSACLVLRVSAQILGDNLIAEDAGLLSLEQLTPITADSAVGFEGGLQALQALLPSMSLRVLDVVVFDRGLVENLLATLFDPQTFTASSPSETLSLTAAAPSVVEHIGGPAISLTTIATIFSIATVIAQIVRRDQLQRHKEKETSNNNNVARRVVKQCVDCIWQVMYDTYNIIGDCGARSEQQHSISNDVRRERRVIASHLLTFLIKVRLHSKIDSDSSFKCKF
jgi:hypothetical protein